MTRSARCSPALLSTVLWLALLAASGCAIPFASPPLHVTQSFGLASGALRPERTARRLPVAAVEPVSVTRVGVNPLQLVSGLRDRRFDFGVGYAFETFTADQLLGQLDKHAVYGEFTAFPFSTRLDEQVGARVGATLTADVLFGDAGYGVHVGGGGSLALSLELFGFAGGALLDAPPHPAARGEHHWDEEEEDGDALLAVALGEWSVAMSAVAAYRALDGASYAEVGVALSVRLPASAGVFILFPSTSHRSGHGGGGSQRSDDDARSSSDDGYHADETTPSDGGIGAESGDDDDSGGTVEVNPPPAGTVPVNPR